MLASYVHSTERAEHSLSPSTWEQFLSPYLKVRCLVMSKALTLKNSVALEMAEQGSVP